MAFRIEKDTMGEVQVPADKYWAAQTERSRNNFKIGPAASMPHEIIEAFGYLKKAAAFANCDLGVLPAEKRDLIATACDEILAGKLDDQFPLVIWQTGSGTQSNMNVNEVVANRAHVLHGGKLGEKSFVHPNDDVNKSQSSNDTFPTAMHIAAYKKVVEHTIPCVERLQKTFAQKAAEFNDVVKEYNSRQKREDRKIKDYFEHVAGLNQDMAVEIIFQCGDKKYWDEHWKNKNYMSEVFDYILECLQKLLPEFKIANAVIHFDEASPHMHVVGVPVWEGAKRGLSKKVSKRNVFTPQTLSVILQDKLREEANYGFEYYFKEELAEKKKGRNHDLSVTEYKVAQESKKLADIKQQNNEEQEKNSKLRSNINAAETEYAKYEDMITDKKNNLERLSSKESELIEKTKIAESVYEMFRQGGTDDVREKLIDVMYENQKLKEENTTLKELLEKAYEFMKQFVIDGVNLLERFLESMGKVIEKIR